MKKLIIPALIIVALVTIFYYLRHPLTTQVIINNHTFNVDLAVTNQEKQLGLGKRDSLASNSGMLFVYDRPDRYTFWMKDMNFPLDFVWINGVTVVDLTSDVKPVSPGQPLSIYSPKTPVDKVLEVNTGTIKRDGISVGNIIIIKN